jgi:hypothetical protein
MPSIRVYVIPSIAKEFTPVFEDQLFRALRQKVAASLGLKIENTEALRITVDRAHNVAPLSIDVMYSVRPGVFEPNEYARKSLAEELAHLAISFKPLPIDITQVSVWILPQHDAVFATANKVP